MAITAATTTNDTFRTVDGRPIFWRDKQGTVHACEGADVHPGIRLIWTLCQRDVPANAAYVCVNTDKLAPRSDEVTCAACKPPKKRRWFEVLPDPQHDEHVWAFYQFWNDAPWPVFDHVSAWGEWSDLNTAIKGEWI